MGEGESGKKLDWLVKCVLSLLPLQTIPVYDNEGILKKIPIHKFKTGRKAQEGS